MKKYMTVFLLFLFGCRSEYNEPLPNNHLLYETNSDTVFIMYTGMTSDNTHAPPVPPKIVKMGVHENIVYGLVQHSPDCDEDLRKYSYSGYFILDTMRKQTLHDLEYDEFLAHLLMMKIIAKGEKPVMKKL